MMAVPVFRLSDWLQMDTVPIRDDQAYLLEQTKRWKWHDWLELVEQIGWLPCIELAAQAQLFDVAEELINAMDQA